MSRFLRNTWRMVYFWKLLLTGAVLLFALVVLNLGRYDFNLAFSPGIKAPIFALASATTLFIGMVPKNPGPHDVFADVSVRIVGAVTACLAGWHWLLGEIDGDASGYLPILVGIAVILFIIIVVIPFLVHLTTFFSDTSPSKDTSEDG